MKQKVLFEDFQQYEESVRIRLNSIDSLLRELMLEKASNEVVGMVTDPLRQKIDALAEYLGVDFRFVPEKRNLEIIDAHCVCAKPDKKPDKKSAPKL